MSKKLVWDQTSERLYETGVKKGVLYSMDASGAYSKGVAWNGLTAVTESPSGAEVSPLYADDIKYVELMSNEEFGATIEAYTYPDEFAMCDGSAAIAEGIVGVTVGQQKRKKFGMSYQTVLGNDTDGNDFGYKLHLIYGAMAAPSEKAYATINDSPEAITFSWEVTTTPVEVPDLKPTASITIDSTKADKNKLKKLEDILYGSDENEARLPLPEEIITIFKEEAEEPEEEVTININVKAVDDGTQVHGVKASELQENIVVTEDAITGTLKHKTSYTGFSSDTGKQEGNYLALAITSDEGTTIKTQLLNGSGNEVEVTDGFCVYRITSKDTQKVKITSTKSNKTVMKEYLLTGLTCNEE